MVGASPGMPRGRHARNPRAIECSARRGVNALAAAFRVRASRGRRPALAGLTGDFSAHSLRSGFMTEAGRQNVPLGEAMALTGHRSIQTAMRYFQAGAVQESRAADLLQAALPNGEVKNNQTVL